MESNIAAIVAALDLSLVRLLRDAAGDDELCRRGMRGLRPEPEIQPRYSVDPEPHIRPRPHIDPEPEILPRPQITPEARVEPAETAYFVDESARPGNTKKPIEPPWALLPWEQKVEVVESPPAPVKPVRVQPDMVKGRLIDVMS